jgi:hypothetical protein
MKCLSLAVEVVAAYQAGESSIRIAKRLGLSKGAVLGVLRRHGIARRPISQACRIHSLDESAFDVVTEESAYFVGLLMADGGVANRKRPGNGTEFKVALTLTASDVGLLERFRAFLKSTHKISFSEGGLRSGRLGKQVLIKPHAQLAVSSKRLVEALEKFGVVPRKSLKAKAIGLENNRDFWRGVIDGDGTVRFNRINGKNYPEISLVGARPLLTQFSEFVRSFCQDIRASVRPSGSIFQVHVNGVAAAHLAEVLYGNCVVALQRKLDMARRFPAWIQEHERQIATREKAVAANRHCCAEGCKRPAVARAASGLRMCQMHLRRFKRNGNLDRVRATWSHLTREHLETAYREHRRWHKVANSLGVHRTSLLETRKRLGMY